MSPGRVELVHDHLFLAHDFSRMVPGAVLTRQASVRSADRVGTISGRIAPPYASAGCPARPPRLKVCYLRTFVVPWTLAEQSVALSRLRSIDQLVDVYEATARRRARGAPPRCCANLAQNCICAGQIVPPAGFEPAAFCSGGRRSIP